MHLSSVCLCCFVLLLEQELSLGTEDCSTCPSMNWEYAYILNLAFSAQRTGIHWQKVQTLKGIVWLGNWGQTWSRVWKGLEGLQGQEGSNELWEQQSLLLWHDIRLSNVEICDGLKQGNWTRRAHWPGHTALANVQSWNRVWLVVDTWGDPLTSDVCRVVGFSWLGICSGVHARNLGLTYTLSLCPWNFSILPEFQFLHVNHQTIPPNSLLDFDPDSD